MPVPVIKTATGRHLVLQRPAETPERTVAYCRVSSGDQKADLERQAGRVVTAATGMARPSPTSFPSRRAVPRRRQTPVEAM